MTCVEWRYNTTYHSSIKMTPFEVVYGRPPTMITEYMPGSSMVDQVDKKLLDRDKIIQLLRDNLAVSQARLK